MKEEEEEEWNYGLLHVVQCSFQLYTRFLVWVHITNICCLLKFRDLTECYITTIRWQSKTQEGL